MSGKWNLLQWKFTACRYNIENANGFNTFSMSEGLSREDKEDLIRGAGAYTPPDHLPYQPTPAEISELFPVMFSSFPLRSGKKAVVRTVYVGKDYAGVRWGNFFSHGLILPGGSWPFYPIRLWNSPLFADGLSETELRLTSTPDPLPIVKISEDDLNDFSWDIPPFLSEESSRSVMLTPLINSVRDGQTNGKPVLLRDMPENITHWIAAVQYAFPLKLAGAVTFTTYAKSQPTSQKFHLVGTSTEGNDFSFGSTSLNATNSVFDFLEQKCPNATARARFFTDYIKSDEASYPGTDLREIQEFMDGIDCRLSDDSLDKAVLLYKFLQWNIIPEDRKILSAILDFYGSQPLDVRQRQTSQILVKDYIYDTGTLLFLLPIIIKTAKESSDYRSIMQSFLFFCRKQFETDVRQLTPVYCSERFALIETLVEHYRKDVAEPLFSYVQQLVGKVSVPQNLAFLYHALLLCLYSRHDVDFIENAEYAPILNNEEFQFFYNATLDLAVSKAYSASIHQYIIKQHTSRFGFDDAFATRYINLMQQRNQGDNARRYGMDQWKLGKSAEPQGAAFIDYIINHAPTDEWTVWIGFPDSFRPYHKTITNAVFSRNRLWTIFDIDERVLSKSASRVEKKKKWEYIANIRSSLETIVSGDRKFKLKFLGFPTWWDIWKSTVISLVFIFILILAFGFFTLLYFSGVFEKSSDEHPSNKVSEAAVFEATE